MSLPMKLSINSRKTAVLVSVLTRALSHLGLVHQEVHEFCARAEQNAGGVVVDNKTRVFKVIKTPVDEQESLLGCDVRIFLAMNSSPRRAKCPKARGLRVRSCPAQTRAGTQSAATEVPMRFQDARVHQLRPCRQS